MSKNLKVMYSKETDDWKTPKIIYEYYKKNGYIDLFPYKSTKDQYEINYKKKKLFCNPPYSKMKKVTKYLIDQLYYDNEIALLIPARTDTKYFHQLLQFTKEIEFIEGRLKFNDDKKSAPFPTIIMHLNLYKLISPFKTTCIKRNIKDYENTNN